MGQNKSKILINLFPFIYSILLLTIGYFSLNLKIIFLIGCIIILLINWIYIGLHYLSAYILIKNENIYTPYLFSVFRLGFIYFSFYAVFNFIKFNQLIYYSLVLGLSPILMYYLINVLVTFTKIKKGNNGDINS